jgi:hypothetical protein
MAGIDAAAVERITGVLTGTVNMWIRRGLIPGMSVGTQGSAREFDLDTVLHIAVMGALGRLGFAAPFAARAASDALDEGFHQLGVRGNRSVRKRRSGPSARGAKLVIGPPREIYGFFSMVPVVDPVIAETPEKLDAFLDTFPDGRPEAFVVVEIDRIAARVREAFSNPDLTERARGNRGVAPRRSVRKTR